MKLVVGKEINDASERGVVEMSVALPILLVAIALTAVFFRGTSYCTVNEHLFLSF